MKAQPLWRWCLFCAALNLYWATRWDWARRVFGWCVLPSWLGQERAP